jgi:quercetin dioxygenase-like cupin family protein
MGVALPSGGYALKAGQGDVWWFLGHRVTFKAAGSQTRNGLVILEVDAPAGYAPPNHIHSNDDEAFYVLEGSLAVACGPQTWEVGPGGFAMLPRQIPHGLKAGPNGCRFLVFTTPAQFEHFVMEVGRRGQEPDRRDGPSAEDEMSRVRSAAPRYGIRLVRELTERPGA